MTATLRAPRGFTLVEVMVAMALLVIGSVGVIGLANQSARMNGDGRRMTRAVALAQDLVQNIELWSYDDPRLANGVTTNDNDIGDDAEAFETDVTPVADHREAELTGTTWLGVPHDEIAAAGYERFWNVSDADDWNGNGTRDLKRIAVIVRWPQGAAYRRIVLYTTKPNPADAQ